MPSLVVWGVGSSHWAMAIHLFSISVKSLFAVQFVAKLLIYYAYFWSPLIHLVLRIYANGETRIYVIWMSLVEHFVSFARLFIMLFLNSGLKVKGEGKIHPFSLVVFLPTIPSPEGGSFFSQVLFSWKTLGMLFGDPKSCTVRCRWICSKIQDAVAFRFCVDDFNITTLRGWDLSDRCCAFQNPGVAELK